MEDGKHVPGSVYFYAPNKGAPVFFAIAFASTGAFHIYQCIYYKCWKLTGFYVFCAVLFTAGFITRAVGTFDYENLVKYIVSTCLIYAAPPIVELGNYHILGRILYYVPYHSPIHPGRVLTTFAFISFLVEVLNANGVAYYANQSLEPWQLEIGKALLKTALVLQLGVLGLFVLLAVTFQRRCLRAGLRNAKLTSAMTTLYMSTALIGSRTVFRVVEYWSISGENFWEEGLDPNSLSPMIRYEWFFWVFEASLMIANHVLMNVRHPRRYLPKSAKTFLAQDGVTEVDGPGYKDSRPFLMTLVDPFDVVGLVKGRDKQQRFWEQVGEGEKGAQQGPKRDDVEAQT
ncbi:hypothetical protein VTK26DRAFT_1819 [Humicola hyalothermophila]